MPRFGIYRQHNRLSKDTIITRTTIIRIVAVSLSLAALGLVAYPLLGDKIRVSANSNLLSFYLSQIRDTFSAYEINWSGVGYTMLLVGIAFAIEFFVLGWRRSSIRRLLRLEDKSSVNDMFYWLMATFQLNGLVRFVLTLGAATLFTQLIKQLNFDINLIYRIDNVYLKYLVAFLIMDFMGYFQHRLAHSWGWWWELHKIHHSAEKFNMVTFYRTHVLESLPRAVIYGIAIALVGSWHVFIIYYALLNFISMLVHSELQHSWGWLEKILVAPRTHKIHHSTNPEHHDKNFGFTLIIWDRMLGTFCPAEEGQEIKIGLKNNPFNKSNPIADLLLAYKNSVAAFFAVDLNADARDVSVEPHGHDMKSSRSN